MRISTGVLLDFLQPYSPVSLLSEKASFSFDGIRILSEPMEEVFSNLLYVGNMEQLKLIPKAQAESICVVCIGEREACEKFLLKQAGNLIVLPENPSVFDVVNTLYAHFDGFKKWVNEVEQSILRGDSYQELISLGKPVFGENPLIFCDGAYNIIGATHKETPYHDQVDSILKRGYYPKDITDAFSTWGYQSRAPYYTDVTVRKSHAYLGCPFFVLGCHSTGGVLMAFMVAYFVKTLPTEGQKDVFSWFAKRIREHYMAQINPEKLLAPTPLERFMSDLIEHTRDDEEYLIDRARSLNLPLDASYRLGVVQWKEFSPGQANYVIARLRNSLKLAHFRVMLYRQSVLVLMRGELPSLRFLIEVNESFAEFRDLLKVCDGYVGISTTVDSLMKLDVAYKQAQATAHYGRLLHPADRLYFYSRYYIYEMLDSHQQKYDLEDMYIQKLDLLKNPDEGSFSNLDLLRLYLYSERNLTATARDLHLHRNSVIYRVNKIQDILGMDLDDPDVRLRLMISFKILELKNCELKSSEGESVPKELKKR